MVYNLRSIGLSLMQNTDVDLHISSSEWSDTGVSASSLNNPSLIKQQQFSRPHSKLKSHQTRKNDSSTVKNRSGNYSASRLTRGGTPQVSAVNAIMSKKFVDSNNNDVLSFDISNNSSTKMTTSDTNASSSRCEPSQHQIYRKSASVACLEPSSFEPKGGNVTATTSGVNESLTCSVLNCSAHFSSKQALQQHDTLFKHSPCNPVLLNINSSLTTNAICYMCPKCDCEFQKPEECTLHMVSENHSPFYPPLAVKAYMCAQCLHLFESFEECWKHLENMSHHNVTYAFSDDQSTSGNGQGGPIAVVKELVEDFISRCGKVPYSLQCLECGLQIESSAKLQEHKLETSNQHTVASFTETTVVDIFANYLATYVCNTCHRLFSGDLKELAKHQCATTTIGTVVDNDTHSFAEFVKRCGLTLIKSLEVGDACLPGPSRCSRRMRRMHWMDTVGDKDSDTSDIEIEPEIHKCDTSEEGKDEFDVKGKTGVLKGGRNQFKAVGKCLERTKGDNVVDSFRGKQCDKNSNDMEKSENLNVIVLDDSDTSDDIESIVNGGSKRKRKQKISDRNKQLACDAQCSSNGAKGQTGLQDDFTKDTGSPVCINLLEPDNSSVQDISTVSTSIRYNLRDRASAQRSDVLAVPETSRERTSQLGDVDNKIGNQSKSVISNPYGNDKKKRDPRNISNVVIEIDSEDEVREPKKAGTASGFTQPKAGPSSTPLFNPAGPSLVNLVSAQRAISPTLCSSYSLTNPFAAFNFIPHSPQLPQNILTQGFVRQPVLIPTRAVNIIDAPVYFTSPLPNTGTQPSRYFLRNSTTYARQPFPTTAITSQPRNIQWNGQQQNVPLVSHPRDVQSNVHSQNIPSASQPQNIPSVSRPQNVQSNVLSQNIPLPSQPQNTPSVSRPQDVQGTDLTSTDNLKRMKNIIFLDLDNWPSFFHKLPTCLPDLTFVWGFFGGKNCWFEPNRLAVFRTMKYKGLFYLNERCGFTKDAADFAIVLTVGKMDERLPSDIAFTILSGDKGFIEVERQMKDAKRKVLVVNPHTAAQFSNDMIYALVTSITDS